jgi:hypothetical protein
MPVIWDALPICMIYYLHICVFEQSGKDEETPEGIIEDAD